MAVIKNTLIIFLFGAFLFNLGLLAFAFTRKDKRRASCFSMLAVATLFYTLGYMLEIVATTPGEAMMALRIENLGIPLIAPFCLLTALGFYQPRFLRKWMTISVVVYGAFMFLMIFFNHHHHLYYSSLTVKYNGYFYAIQQIRGPLAYVQQVITLTCMLVQYYILVVQYVRGSEKVRSQMVLFIFGSLFAFVGNLLYLLGVIPLGIDPVPFSVTIGLICFAVILFKHKLMDIVPAAFDMAIENMDDVAIVLDSDWGLIYCNQKAKSLFPMLVDFSSTEEITQVEGWPNELAPESGSETSFSIINPSTQKITQHQANIHDINDGFGRILGVSIIIRDITEATNLMKQLEELAITDPLTGVYNRRHFMTLLDRQMGMAQRHDMSVSIIMLDVDHFKKVNDTYSHLAGDYVLCELARTITRQMRGHDVIARYGGEEFIILSAEKEESSLMAFANRLRKAIEDDVIEYEGNKIRITGSFGAVIIKPGQTFAAGMQAVDRALYEAKNNGRNQVILGTILPEDETKTN